MPPPYPPASGSGSGSGVGSGGGGGGVSGAECYYYLECRMSSEYQDYDPFSFSKMKNGRRRTGLHTTTPNHLHLQDQG